MKIKGLPFYIFCIYIFSSCSRDNATIVSNNTFAYKNKVYKIVGNKVTVLEDLDSKDVIKLDSLKPQKISLGEYNLSYIKPNANATFEGLYRGDLLYYRLTINNFSDLSDNYVPGKFMVELQDEFGFILNSEDIPTSDLTGMVNNNGKVYGYVYNGKIQMSADIVSAIKSYRVSSTVRPK